MKKNKEFRSQEEYQDGKYKVLSITDGDKNLRRVVCDTPGICLLPFDKNGDNIRNLYLARYTDYLTDEQGHTCITKDSNGEFDTAFEEIQDCTKNELGIDIDVDDVYYLGTIKHNMPFTKSYKCYGIALDGHSKDPSGFKLDLPEVEGENRLYTLDKIKLTRVLKGDIEDSLCMSASLLLISYMD